MKRHFGARPAESFTRSKYWIAASLKREGTVCGLERTLTSIANDRCLRGRNRRYLIDGSHARVIIGGDEAAPLRLGREKRGDESDGPLKCCCYGANAGRVPVGSNIEALFLANAAFFLERLLRRIVRFVSRNKRSRDGALEQVSSKQLVPSREQGRLR
jgi:hypothetical protein